jgi:hypothetical protein
MSLQPLPKSITDEIRQILEDCQSGKLKHNQADAHCGSSHCVCGWKAVLDYAKERGDTKVLSANFDTEKSCSQKVSIFAAERSDTHDDSVEEYNYAKTVWRLTNSEAIALFSPTATFEEQFALLEKLERGERIEQPLFCRYRRFERVLTGI